MVKILDDLGGAIFQDETANNSKKTPTIVTNNNPGALEDGPFARSQPGYVPGGGRFAKFATEADGIRAQETLLREGKRYKGKSFVEVLNAYTPPTKENPPEARANYIGYVAASAGIDPSKPIPPEKIPDVARAMREFETGKKKNVKFTPYGGQMSAGNTSSPGQGIVNPEEFLSALQSKLAPESMASEGVTTSAPTIFGSDTELQTRAGKVEEQLAAQGQTIDILTQVTDIAQATQLATMQATVEESRAISQEITEGTQALKRQVQPVFQARGRIADQLDQLNTMNPIERGLRSIFDLNYNRGFLKNQLDNYDRTLAMRANDFDYLNKLHDRALQEIDRRYGLDNALTGLAVEQTKEDLGIVGLRLQQTAGMLGSLRDRLAAESQVISAKALAREDMLSRIDGPTVMKLATDAKNGNGTVKFNGVEFSYGELRDRLERDEDQELNREAHRMAIANGRMDLANSYATNLARSLTREQAEAAIANGGVHNGVQLPQDVLQQVYAGHMQTDATRAESIEKNLPASLAMQAATESWAMMDGLRTRTRDMFGGKGIEGVETYMATGTEIIQQLIEATTNGSPPEVITMLTKKMADNAKAMEASLDQSLLRQAGGDQKAAGYLKSFVMGVPMDSTASIQAITHFAVRGSRPDGVAMTPEAKQIFQFAEEKVREILDADPKISKAALEQRVSIALSDHVGKTVGQARLERVLGSLPTLARSAGNPIGKISADAWSRARANAAASAYAGVANQLGIQPDEVRRMRSTAKPLDSTPESKALYDKFVAMSPQFNALEHQALISEIDELPQITKGYRNSDYLIQFMSSPEFNRQADGYEQSTGDSSFGDYLVNPMSKGSLSRMVGMEASGLEAAQADRTRADRETVRMIASGFAHNPAARASTILSTIPGVGKEGAAKLVPEIQAFIKLNDGKFNTGGMDRKYDFVDSLPWNASTRMEREDSQIYNFLSSTKFADPSLEAWRKAAIKGWEESKVKGYSFMETLWNSTLNFGGN